MRDDQIVYSQYSCDMIQKLTFFIISIELIFCGYMLLNFEKFGKVQYSSLLFFCGGTAAIFGLLWRFFYNQNFYDITHKKDPSKYIDIVQGISYWVYVSLTMIFLF